MCVFLYEHSNNNLFKHKNIQQQQKYEGKAMRKIINFFFFSFFLHLIKNIISFPSSSFSPPTLLKFFQHYCCFSLYSAFSFFYKLAMVCEQFSFKLKLPIFLCRFPTHFANFIHLLFY